MLPEPELTERPVVPQTSGPRASVRPPDRREKKTTRRGARAALALAGVSAVVAGLIPGDTGITPGDTGTHQTAARPRTANPQAATAVDATWAPRAKKALAQVNDDLSQIDKAEAAAAAVPQEKWSARLRALMQRLEQRASDLKRLRTLLQSNLSLVTNYGRAAESLAGAKKQLGLLNQARESLRSLSGPAREEMTSILNGLAVQAGKLSREERSHQDAEESLRKPAAEASNQALPDLPDDIRGLVREVNEEADASNPSRPHHGQDRGSPWADRPPSPPQRPPGRSNRTGAPPHPHSPSPSANDEPSTPADHGKAPVRHEPSTPSKPATPAPADPAPQKPQAPARPATPSGGGSQFSVDTGSGGGDSGSAVSDASDSSDSDGAASDASDASGSDAGSDAGSDGSDGGDGGDGGGDGGGGE